MQFEFATAARILFGAGTVREVPTAARALGQRALLVTGRTVERSQALAAGLEKAGVGVCRFIVPSEPSTNLVREGSRLARQEKCDLVVAFGGGSVIDAAKAIAAMQTNPGELLDYLEVVGQGKPLTVPPVALVAIPTTAGTGAEVTRNAVLVSPEHRFKVSLRAPGLLPRLAVVDPALTYGLPRELTASTGLDALTQLIEPFVSCRAQPFTDGLCREGIPRVANSLRRAWERPEEERAREDMALASLFSGLALANAGLGAVHGFAAPLGAMFPAPHGAVCAALLPHVMEVNIRALRQRQPQNPALQRYQEVARLLTGRDSAGHADGVAWVRELCGALEIPALRAYGVTNADVPAVCAKAAQASSMKANPLPLTPEELAEILSGAI